MRVFFPQTFTCNTILFTQHNGNSPQAPCGSPVTLERYREHTLSLWPNTLCARKKCTCVCTQTLPMETKSKSPSYIQRGTKISPLPRQRHTPAGTHLLYRARFYCISILRHSDLPTHTTLQTTYTHTHYPPPNTTVHEHSTPIRMYVHTQTHYYTRTYRRTRADSQWLWPEKCCNCTNYILPLYYSYCILQQQVQIWLRFDQAAFAHSCARGWICKHFIAY